MTHPEHLLAGYVDGSISPRDRAAVDAHLHACARCAREVRAAAEARAALAALPTVTAPAGVADAALAEAGISTRHRTSGPPAWYRWGGIAAAAAAGLLVLALALPKLGTNANDAASEPSRAEAAAPGTTSAGVSVVLETSDVDYTPDSLEALATDFAAAPDEGQGRPVAEPGGTGRAARATACLAEAVRPTPGDPVRLIEASFQGTPAYLGFYERGSGGTSILVVAADATTCTPLSASQVNR